MDISRFSFTRVFKTLENANLLNLNLNHVQAEPVFQNRNSYNPPPQADKTDPPGEIKWTASSLQYEITVDPVTGQATCHAVAGDPSKNCWERPPLLKEGDGNTSDPIERDDNGNPLEGWNITGEGIGRANRYYAGGKMTGLETTTWYGPVDSPTPPEQAS